MNRKILTLLVLLIAISTISIVSAADTQTIGGMEFNVPEGYVYDADSADAFLSAFSDESEIEDAGVFKNSNDDLLAILIYGKEPEETDFPSDYKIESKTINGKNGTFFSAPSKINVGFTYNDGDKFVVIQAMNEDIVKQTIK